jgi:hypothetical protein
VLYPDEGFFAPISGNEVTASGFVVVAPAVADQSRHSQKISNAVAHQVSLLGAILLEGLWLLFDEYAAVVVPMTFQ